MPYCSLDDLINSLTEQTVIEASNDDLTSEVVDEEKIDRAIEMASNEIDGYIRGRYTLPLTTVPAVIKDIAVDLSIYYLWGRRPEKGIPEDVTERYKNRIKLLLDIQKGNFLLEVAQIGSSAGGSGFCRTNKTSSDRLFNKDLLNRF